MHQVNTALSLTTNAGMMTTSLEAEFSTVWFDPQAMTTMLRFGNISKQDAIQHLQESDTSQIQLCDHVNIFGSKQGD